MKYKTLNPGIIFSVFQVFVLMTLSGNLFAQTFPAYPTTRGSVSEERVRLPFYNEPQTVPVERVGDMILYQGDIRVELASGRGGASISNIDSLWTNGIIPYQIKSGHPYRDTILKGIRILNNRTPLRIVPYNSSIHTSYVYIQNDGTGCWSWIGNRIDSVRQTINLDTNCGLEGVQHELLHAAGFYHEHCRSDRDSFINVDLSKMVASWRSQFTKAPVSASINWTRYDTLSIMHYEGDHSGIESTPGTPYMTIKRNGVDTGRPTRRNRVLSAGDISAIYALYAAYEPILRAFNWSASPGTPSGTGGASGGGSSPAGAPARLAVDIRYDVDLVPQRTSVSCWAAGAAMLVGWADSVSIDPEEIARGTGYWRRYYNQTGLPPSDTTMFRRWGLVPEYPACYTVAGFASLLAHYGPLWVAAAVDLTGPGSANAHIRVVTGMRGDGTPDGTRVYINDPWDRGMTSFREPNSGSQYNMTFTEFMREMENLGARELREPSAWYIAHNP
ncbi:MAG: M12 family metallopeptidase [Bacteroidia bacterium]|nr:M12 family metallopeptidase [Bacteroidia bacterium]